METSKSIQSVKSLFKSNFTELLNGKLIELNQSSIKVMASYENNEGGFYEPQLIMEISSNKVDEEAISEMLEAIDEGWVEIVCKKQNHDYIITAGSNEVVYVIKMQIFIIK
jgi:hypothetical protein